MLNRLALLILLLPGCLATPPDRPNILLIVADDLGWGDVGYHGSAIRTPHLDRLAATGLELDQHYVQPQCSPTRAALLTGRYPGRFGPHAQAATNLRALPPRTLTLASALQSMGYDTGIAGKWHLGSRPEWGPNHYGFNRSYGTLTGAADPWTHLYRKGPYASTWHRDLEFLEEQGNATELIAAETLRWIKARREPWFLYVPMYAVHVPVDAPQRYLDAYQDVRFDEDPVRDESARRYAAFTSQMDAKIGEFLTALDETGQRDDTLVIFFSDNGAIPSWNNPYLSDVPDSPVLGSNAPLRGQKGQVYEGGIRVPAVLHWPGRLEQRVVRAPMHAVDWMPTLCRLAGFTPDREPNWDGQDVWPLFTASERGTAGPRTLYWKRHKERALRHADWKLVIRGNKTELFHLGDDPCEQQDLSTRRPDKVEELRELLRRQEALDVTALPGDLAGLPG